MTKPTLLPSGLMDVLPPFAAAEFRLIHHFLKIFSSFAYQPVIPPLAEFETSLLAGQGEATAAQVFRVTDPHTSHMLALRADITGQVARIASSSLHSNPRPLRLCYAGYTLRTTAEALKTRRQHTQVGIERFGDAAAASVAEVLAIACFALKAAGVSALTIDLHYPSILAALLADHPASQHAKLREAVRMKDTAQLRHMNAGFIADLIDSAGNATHVLSALRNYKHAAVTEAVATLDALHRAFEAHQLHIDTTIDVLDLTGYGYYTGPGYSIYWKDANTEVGRGGCYQLTNGEEAVGFTLYINDLLDKLGIEKTPPLIAVPESTPIGELTGLHAQGYVTAYASGDLKAQGFTKQWDGKTIKDV